MFGWLQTKQLKLYACVGLKHLLDQNQQKILPIADSRGGELSGVSRILREGGVLSARMGTRLQVINYIKTQ